LPSIIITRIGVNEESFSIGAPRPTEDALGDVWSHILRKLINVTPSLRVKPQTHISFAGIWAILVDCAAMPEECLAEMLTGLPESLGHILYFEHDTTPIAVLTKPGHG
jgi:hypothetical protein